MTSLIEFLTARLDEDEAAAQAASKGPWEVDDLDYAESITDANGYAVVAGGRWGDEASVFTATEDAVHIARHDPARVLREVEAKRHLLDEYSSMLGAVYVGERPWDHIPTSSVLEEFVISMAEIYSDHPDFDPNWSAP